MKPKCLKCKSEEVTTFEEGSYRCKKCGTYFALYTDEEVKEEKKKTAEDMANWLKDMIKKSAETLPNDFSCEGCKLIKKCEVYPEKRNSRRIELIIHLRKLN